MKQIMPRVNAGQSQKVTITAPLKMVEDMDLLASDLGVQSRSQMSKVAWELLLKLVEFYRADPCDDSNPLQLFLIENLRNTQVNGKDES